MKSKELDPKLMRSLFEPRTERVAARVPKGLKAKVVSVAKLMGSSEADAMIYILEAGLQALESGDE